MSVKVIKPMSLGILHKPYRYKQKHYLSVAALGFFRLGQKQPGLLNENQQWPVVMKSLAPGEMLDMAMPKPHAEVLMAAKACTPGAKPLQQMDVSLEMGKIKKRLRVYGERQWLYGLMPLFQITPPQTFTVMPLTWQRAYGGEQYKDNPWGTGFTGQRLAAFSGQNQGQMPNVEYAGVPVKNHYSHYAPAGFSALDMRLPQRQAKAGTYDQKWMQKDFPGLPDDIDFSIFNCAPDDQQLTGFLAGGEAYCLQGMHPDHAVLKGNLPRFRVRGFICDQGANPSSARALDMQGDTVWFFPDQQLGVMIWRGQTEVKDSDALDVASITLAYEHATDTARPESHYHDVIAKRSDIKTAAQHAFNESQLTPCKTQAQQLQRQQQRQQDLDKQQDKRQQQLDALREEAHQQHECAPEKIQAIKAKSPLIQGPTASEIASGDFDLSSVQEQAEKLLAQKQEEARQKQQELEAQKALLAEVPQTPEPKSAEPVSNWKDIQQRAQRVASDLTGEPAVLDAHSAQLLQGLEQAQRAGKDVLQQKQQLLAQSTQQAINQRKGRQAAPRATAPAEALSAQDAKRLGDQVKAWLAKGICLAGRDLAGANLEGVSFAGQDLREVMLEKAQLKGASFKGANLSGAVFTEADISQCNFTQANLEKANLCGVKASQSRFIQANMQSSLMLDGVFDQVDFTQADLSSCVAIACVLTDSCLQEGVFAQSNFSKCQAQNSQWQKGVLNMTLFANACLVEANFTESSMQRCVFIAAECDSSIFDHSQLERVQSDAKASFKKASFKFVDATVCGFRGACFSESDLSQGRFIQCDFSLVNFNQANLEQAVLCKSLFMQSVLVKARLNQADFFKALCRKTDFSHSDLRQANLVQTELTEAVFENTRLDKKQQRERRAA